MAFGSRNSLLAFFLILGLLLAAFFMASAVFSIVVTASGARINFFASHPFWHVFDITPYGDVSSCLGIAILFLIGFLGFYVFRIFFKKVGQAEVFFFALFLFSLVPEILRLAVLSLQLLELPPAAGILLSRIVYGSRIFGLLSLLSGSLYALDLQYQKFEIVILVLLLFAFALTFSVPFDSQLLLTDGLFRLSDEQGMFIIYFSLILFLAVNYSITVFRGRTFLILLGVLLLLAGREFLFFSLSPLLLLTGGGLSLAGLIIAYRGFALQYNLT